MEQIKFYFKLPRWFTIETPLGKYNPDWAIIFNGDKRIYFVAETKASTSEKDLRLKEKLRIKCGLKHFEELEDVEFKVVEDTKDLIN